RPADDRAETALRYMFGARQEYLEAAIGKAEELYGSFRGFIRDGLNIQDEEIEAWKSAILI
ncbi:MAG: tyrosine-protein phosphatase, partial [Firmicutes bacterium]|nr:tyrosine-protein phosphatase [Bacillota bacterium]